MIVLLGVLQLSRRQARQVSTTDIHIDTSEGRTVIRVGDLVVPRTDTPGPCPSCAITRWLRIIHAISAGHRDVALDLVNLTLKNETHHDCDHPLTRHSPSGGGGGGMDGPLLLSLTTEGWTQPGVALSVRSISRIIHNRRIPTDHVEDPTYQRPTPMGRFRDATADEVYEAAGQVDDKADQLLQRSTQLLDLME